MRRVHKARIVPDHAPAGMTEKVILVKDLGMPPEIALGELEAARDEDLMAVQDTIIDELLRRDPR